MGWSRSPELRCATGTASRSARSGRPKRLWAEPDRRRGDALDHHVDAGWQPARQRALDCAGQVDGAFDMLAVAAERRHDEVVARGQKLAAVHAVGAVVAALDLAFG